MGTLQTCGSERSQPGAHSCNPAMIQTGAAVQSDCGHECGITLDICQESLSNSSGKLVCLDTLQHLSQS